MVKKSFKKNKKGIYVFDKGQSVEEVFLSAEEAAVMRAEKTAAGKESEAEPAENDDFKTLLDSYLEGKSADRILKEKSDRKEPSGVPIKKRLKRYPPPESVLDLHGFTGNAAGFRADAYIKNARRQGFFTIRIIVGKGLHSECGAVLPDVVEDVVVRLKKEGTVLSYMWEKKRKSRSGAVIVFLNQFND